MLARMVGGRALLDSVDRFYKELSYLAMERG